MIANSPAAWTERATLADPYEAVMWSLEGQAERFASVLAALNPLPGEILLDYGCGTGALADLVPPDRYLGFDSSPGMVERARRDHPDHRFVDASAPPVPVDVDLVAAVGPFNLADGWGKYHTWATLRFLWGHTRRALAVCLYAGDDPACLSYGTDETSDFAETLDAAYWQIRRHRPNDLLLVLKR